MKRTLRAKGSYTLASVVFSHGWADLRPFEILDPKGTTRVTLHTRSGPVVVTVHPAEEGVIVEGEIDGEVIRDLRWMFRLDDDLSEFYQVMCHEDRPWIGQKRMGRLLRSQTVFEDLVKLILTTNCSWEFTKIMNNRLVENLGNRKLFPSPAALVEKSERFYRETIRSGYRSPHVPKIAAAVLSRKMDLEVWRSPDIPTDVIRKEILSIPGAGPYVADNLLRLLGRADFLGLDSWARGKLKKMWNMKKIPSDKAIEKKYKRFGTHKGLVLWCDLTHDWFEKNPFFATEKFA
jgi:3-methyladenine DNA glycosylase/8-oxoguanine DNA glycosylase